MPLETIGPSIESGPLNGNFAYLNDQISSLPFNLNRQAIINGNFDIWQRGTSFSSAGYTADRWKWNKDGTGQVGSVSQQKFAAGQTDVPGNPTNFARIQVSSPGSGQNFNSFNQPIEGVRQFAGQKVTLSFYAKSDVPRTIQVYFQQVFGTGGSPTVTGAKSNFNLSSVWQKFVATVTLPSISGMTVGQDDYINFIFGLPVGSNFTIDIAQVQLNAGESALPFQPRSFAEELALCQRYYERLGREEGRVNILGVFENATNARCIWFFRTKKRITPTIVQNGAFRFLNGTGTILSAGETTTNEVVINASASDATPFNATLIQNDDTVGQFLAADAEL